MQKRLECQVFGRVQMVMYRDFVKRAARARGVVGTVKNNLDGSVSIVAEGEEKKLCELLARANRGSIFARVDCVEEKWSDLPAATPARANYAGGSTAQAGPLGEFKTFDILY